MAQRVAGSEGEVAGYAVLVAALDRLESASGELLEAMSARFLEAVKTLRAELENTLREARLAPEEYRGVHPEDVVRGLYDADAARALESVEHVLAKAVVEVAVDIAASREAVGGLSAEDRARLARAAKILYALSHLAMKLRIAYSTLIEGVNESRDALQPRASPLQGDDTVDL